MKASKAYIAGLGTTGVLIGSFLLLLAVGSAIVAFNGLPGGGDADGLDRVVVEQEAKTVPASEVDRGARSGARAREDRKGSRDDDSDGGAAGDGRAGAERTGSGDGATGPGLGGGDQNGGGQGGGGSQGGSSGGDGTSGGGTTLPTSPVDTPELPSTEPVTGPVGGAVEDVTGTVGGALGGVSPELGDTVTDTGSDLGGTLDGVDQTVEDTVGSLPDLP